MARNVPASQRDGQSAPKNTGSLGSEGEGPSGKLIRQFERDFRESDAWFGPWRRQAKKYLKTYAGDPWGSADRRRLERSDRPAANLNVSLATINAIVGADMMERRETRFGGEDLGYKDAAVADWLTRVVRHQFNHCQGHRSDSTVLFYGLVTGLGASRTFLDNRRWPFRLKVGHLQPWMVWPDPDANETNLTDRRFTISASSWTRAEVAGRFGKGAAKDLTSPVGLPGGLGTAQHPRVAFADNHETKKSDPLFSRDPDRDKLKIWEYEYKVFEPWVVYTDPTTGQDVHIPREDWDAMGDDAKDLQGFEHPFERLRRAFLAATHDNEGTLELLEDKPLPTEADPIAFYTGFRDVDVDSGRVRWFGLQHVIDEPQLLYAKTLTNMLEYFARGAKGGAFIEADALEDPQQAREDWAKPGALILLKPGGKDKVLERKPVTWPSAMDALMRMLREGITDISAVSDWLKGTANSERSNVLISNLQSQSMTVLAPALDPMSGFRMQQGQAIAQMAVRFLSTSALDKIIGTSEVAGLTHEEDPAQPGKVLLVPETDPMTGQPLMDPMTGMPKRPTIPVQKMAPDGVTPMTPGYILRNEVDLFDFDVQVDVGVASPTARQATFQMLTQHGVLDKMFEAGLPPQEILPELLKMSPLPPEITKPLAEKMKALVSAPTVEQVAQQLQQMGEEERMKILQLLQGGGQPQAAPAPEAVQ